MSFLAGFLVRASFFFNPEVPCSKLAVVDVLRYAYLADTCYRKVASSSKFKDFQAVYEGEI